MILNIPFYPQGDDSLYVHLEYFYLFSKNSKSQITNMLHQKYKETELAFFDFTFEVGTGSPSSEAWGVIHATDYKQSVVYLCSPKLELPQFVLRPEKIIINHSICMILIFPVIQIFQMFIYFKVIQRNRHVICLMNNY